MTEIYLWVKIIFTEISLWVKITLTDISLWIKMKLTEIPFFAKNYIDRDISLEKILSTERVTCK